MSQYFTNAIAIANNMETYARNLDTVYNLLGKNVEKLNLEDNPYATTYLTKYGLIQSKIRNYQEVLRSYSRSIRRAAREVERELEDGPNEFVN